jgi:hypothetical protein
MEKMKAMLIQGMVDCRSAILLIALVQCMSKKMKLANKELHVTSLSDLVLRRDARFNEVYINDTL